MDTDTADFWTRLGAPFPADKIHFRVGATNNRENPTKGIALAYLSAVDVMERLDEVAGPGNWADRYPFAGCCELSVRVGGEWITKSNCAGETDVEGEKGQASTAFKRAAVKFGIGRSLYAMRNAWFDVERKGKSVVFTKDAEQKMRNGYAMWIKRLNGE